MDLKIQVSVEQFDYIHEEGGLRGANEGAGIESTLAEESGARHELGDEITGDVGGGRHMRFHSNWASLSIASHNYNAL